MEAFVCDNTSINSLDVSKNEKLNTLFADSTSISNLDVTNNPNLEQLSCSNTGLMELDVTHNPQLVTLDIGDTKVKTLNNPVPVSLLSGDRKPQIRFLGNHPSGSGNLYHKSFRM